MTCSFAFGFSIKSWMVSPRITSVQYIGGCSVHWGCSVYRRVNMSTSWIIWESKLIKAFDLHWNLNVLNIPQCTEHPPMCSWYPPTWIIISPHLHHGNPLVFWTYPNVLVISPNVLMLSRRCTKHSLPPPPSPPPDISNAHYTWWLYCSQSDLQEQQEGGRTPRKTLCFTWLSQYSLWFVSKSLFTM